MRKSVWTWTTTIGLLSLWLLGLVSACGAEVSAGDPITRDTISQAETLLTPSTRWMLDRGMPMRLIATKRVGWPKACEAATEKFSSQVSPSGDGRRLINYVGGCPFPSIDLNDRLAGLSDYVDPGASAVQYRQLWHGLDDPDGERRRRARAHLLLSVATPNVDRSPV